MKKFTVPLLLLIAIGSKSQILSSQVQGAAGGYFFNSFGSLSWTLGEPMVETYQKSQGFLTQGFHQPLTILITGLEEVNNNISAYPNPVHDLMFLKFVPTGDYQMELFSFQGMKLADQKIFVDETTNEHTLDMSDRPRAHYLIRITQLSTGKIFNYRIIKN